MEVSVLQLIDRGEKKIISRHPDAQGTMDWGLLGTTEGLARIQMFVDEVGAEALATVDEFGMLWLASVRDSFEPKCRLLSPSYRIIDALRAKDTQCALARQAGFHVLPTWSLDGAGDSSLVPDAAFPVCLRPSTFSSVVPSFKAETLHSAADLAAFLASHQWTAPLLTQPFVNGPNVLVHCCRATDGRWLEMKAYRAPVKSMGFAVVLEEIPMTGDLERATQKFAELTGATGCFHFDLLQNEKDGTVYFLEINLRLGGSSAKVQMLGLDEPLQFVRAYGFQLPRTADPLQHYRAAGSLRMLLTHLFHVVRGDAADISYPRGRRLSTLRTLLRYALVLKDPSLPRLRNSKLARGWRHVFGTQKSGTQRSGRLTGGAATRSRSCTPLDRADDSWPCPSDTESVPA